MTDSDDETPRLPADTLAILRQFQEEQRKIAEGVVDVVAEDWQLSQFWYASDTALQLCRELVNAVGESGHIACISCPTLIQYFSDVAAYNDEKITVKLFEYDHRFETKFSREFVPYDYRHPLVVRDEFKGAFDVIIADPPFLADECLVKTAQTIRLLAKPNAKIILCTGAVMEKMADRLLGLHRLKFEPQHANNLSNEFSCFANYETKYL